MSIPPSVFLTPRDPGDARFYPSVIPVQSYAPPSSARVWLDTSTVPATLKGWNGSAWAAIGGAGALNQTELGTGDLDALKTPGFYIQSDTAEATLARHYPVASLNGHLVVESAGGGSPARVVQTFTASSTTTAGARRFWRTFASPTWSPWVELATPEVVRDTMGTALVAGSGVTITPNDGADTITIATSGGGLATLQPTMGIWSGKYTPSGDGGATGTVDVPTNHIIYTPFTAAHSRTLAAVAIDVSTAAAASTVGVAIYAHDDTTGWPGALVANLGTVDSSTTGIKEASTSQALVAGTGYWLAVQPRGGGPTLRMNTARPGLVPSTSASRFGGSAYGSSGGTFPGSFTAVGNGVKDRSVWFELKGA